MTASRVHNEDLDRDGQPAVRVPPGPTPGGRRGHRRGGRRERLTATSSTAVSGRITTSSSSERGWLCRISSRSNDGTSTASVRWQPGPLQHLGAPEPRAGWGRRRGRVEDVKVLDGPLHAGTRARRRTGSRRARRRRPPPGRQQDARRADDAARSVPTSWSVPASTASGRSVFSRGTSTGIPRVGASSCTPPSR